MRSLTTVAAALAVASSVHVAAPARACKLAPPPAPSAIPADRETTGPLPLLFAREGTSPFLRAKGAEDLAIEVVPDATVPQTRWGSFPSVRGWRPAAPLAAGEYVWLGISLSGATETTFYVDPEAPADPPGARAMTLRLVLDAPDQDEGCGGGSDSSCDDIDFTRLELALGPEDDGTTPLAPAYLIELTARGETRRLVIASLTDAQGEGGITLLDSMIPGPSFDAARTCIAVTPLTDAGELGARVDLGCVSPDDDDPRVVDTRGCAGAGASADPWWTLVALAWVVGRSRARAQERCGATRRRSG